MTTKSIAAKLIDARTAFHKLPLKKSGYNTFSKYHYFELADFLIPGLECMANERLLPIISFTEELATMQIVDADTPVNTITITSPMRNLELKGSNAMQALGACETYNSRYLWVAALQIVENDQIDGQKQEEDKPKKPAGKLATSDQKQYLEDLKDDFIPPRRLAWLGAGDNFNTMTEVQAKVIIDECKALEKE
jgi:hypothetical protein